MWDLDWASFFLGAYATLVFVGAIIGIAKLAKKPEMPKAWQSPHPPWFG